MTFEQALEQIKRECPYVEEKLIKMLRISYKLGFEEGKRVGGEINED